MSEVTFQKLKKWTKVFGIKSFGMRRDDMYAALVKEMKKKKDDLTEQQLEWLEQQLGTCKAIDKATSGKKVLKKKAEEELEEKPKKKLLKKKVEEEPEAEEKPKKKLLKKKEVEEPEETSDIKVKIEKKDMKGFAKELGLKDYKPVTDEDYHELAQAIYETVDEMESSDREGLSKPLFKFYTNIKRQTVAEEPEVEEAPPEAAKEIPSTIKLKQWGHLLELKVKGKSDEEVAQAILDKYDELEDSDKEDLPKSLREWAEGVSEAAEETPEAEDEQVELPDIKTLKAYAKAVGLSIKDTMKAKGDPDAIAQMIVDAYDPNSEDEYPEEVKEFYVALTGGATIEAEPESEEVNEEELFINWLVETGFDENEVKTLDKDEMVDLLKSNYEDEDSRADLPVEAVEYLKETFPEMFEPPAKKKLLKKVKK